QPFLNDPKWYMREAAVKAIAEIAAPESIPFFQQTALDSQAKTSIRIAAIKALGKTGTAEAIKILLELLENKDLAVYHPATIRALGNTRSQNALEPLQKYLAAQKNGRQEWRERRDKSIDGYTDDQIEEWRKSLQEVEPKTYLEFNLAYAIAQIDPEGEGVKLLSHDLAKVREGAWLGLARLPLTETRPFFLKDGPAAVALIERLDRERTESKHPLFKHAAYRAIDEMLITIEA
ncbi:MAG: HEAT repeat domain-containing protein, partial [Gammaproteobacteria bacterium]|nr:HEAT repeat domain-containing protein [Gammaproteobacteria bacterium]